MNKRKSRRGKARIFGFGLHDREKHTRITQGEGFRLFDGDEKTHERMQQKALAFMQKVEEKGLSLDNISRGECREILAELGMNIEGMGAA